MDKNGVVVGASYSSGSNLNTAAGSGFILPTKKGCLVITSASWLLSLLEQERNDLQRLIVLLRDTASFSFTVVTASQQGGVVNFKADFVSIVDIPAARAAFERCLLPEACGVENTPLFVHLLSLVLVLRVEDAAAPSVRYNTIVSARSLSTGDPICLLATPFSDAFLDLFINSTIHGHISRCYGNKNEVLLLDCPCVVGCEGGVILTSHHGNKQTRPLTTVAGILTSVVLLKGGALSGLALAIAMDTVMTSLEDKLGISHCFTSVPDLVMSSSNASRDWIKKWSHFVCGVVAGVTSGTGIVLSNSLVLTCAHVTLGEPEVVYVVGKNGRLHPSQVVYSTHPNHVAMDIALLKLSQPLETPGEFPLGQGMGSCCQGDRVCIMGYGLNHPLSAGHVTTFGCVSKILHKGEVPIMIQTTAAANPGCSGGLVVSMETGQPVGMATSIIREVERGELCPSLNMVVPLALLQPSLQAFRLTEDELLAWEGTNHTPVDCH